MCAVLRSYVLEALRKPPTNAHNVRMLKFGMFALEQFKTRLPRWPQYCQHILAIPHLREVNPTLVAEITLCLQQVGVGARGRLLVDCCPHTLSALSVGFTSMWLKAPCTSVCFITSAFSMSLFLAACRPRALRVCPRRDPQTPLRRSRW
jgi:CCR4-NOT transcription complex subunit 1